MSTLRHSPILVSVTALVGVLVILSGAGRPPMC